MRPFYLVLVLIILIGGITAIVFSFDPTLDIAISKVLQAPEMKDTFYWVYFVAYALREYNDKLTFAIIALSIIPLVIKFVWPMAPMLMPGRAALFVTLTFVLCPGLLSNVILKDHWARPRPYQVVEFGGKKSFVPWWDRGGSCARNCSFVSGEASTAFAMMAPVVVAVPMPWTVPAIAGVLTYATTVSFVRVAAGRHFLTDVIFAGVFTSFGMWILYGLLFVWPATKTSDAGVENALVSWRSRLLSRKMG